MLGYTEKEVWKMTIRKISILFEIHKEFNPNKFVQKQQGQVGLDPIDEALGGF